MARKKTRADLFAIIVKQGDAELQSSFFYDEKEAIAYANRMMGVVAVDKLENEGRKRIWTRYGQFTDWQDHEFSGMPVDDKQIV